MQKPYRCTVMDGPACDPMETYYTHSKLMYTMIDDDKHEEITDLTE